MKEDNLNYCSFCEIEHEDDGLCGIRDPEDVQIFYEYLEDF